MVDGTQQCLASGAAAEIGTARYNGGSFSPADVGYMYGDRVESVLKSAGGGNYIFSNDVSRDGNTYTLDTADGQSITGTWADKRVEASTRYHYFCTNGASRCDRSQIGYIFYFDEFDNGLTTISYLPIGGYDNIDAFLAAAYRNDNNSGAKATVENWFANSGLVALEDDLEDAVYCNDRTVAWGAFKGKDSPALIEGDRSIYFYGQLYGESVYGELAKAFTGVTGFSFLVFNLLCAPCFAAIGAIKREMNNAKWTWFAIGYECGFAYAVALVVNQLGNLFTGSMGVNAPMAVDVIFLVVSLGLIALCIWGLFRPYKEAARLEKEVKVS